MRNKSTSNNIIKTAVLQQDLLKDWLSTGPRLGFRCKNQGIDGPGSRLY